MKTFSEYITESLNGETNLDEFIGWIMSDRLETVEKAIAKQNQKFGSNVFTLTTTGNRKTVRSVPCIEVRVVGQVPRLGNWELIGTVDKVNHLIFNNTSGADLEQFRTSTKCAVCGKAISRKTTWIVKSTSTKEESVALSAGKSFTTSPNAIYEIGSTCMKALTGSSVFNKINNAIYNNAVFDLILSDDDLEDFVGDEIAAGRVDFKNCPVPLADAIDVADVLIKKGGFVPSSEYGYKTTTKELLTMAVFDPHYDKSPKVSAKIIKKIREQKSRSDFMLNCQALCSRDTVTSSSFGVLAAMVNTYYKILEREEMEKKVSPKQNGKGVLFTGCESGSKFTGDIKVTLLRKPFMVEGYYGSSICFTFVDEEGHIFTWYCSGAVPSALDNKEEIGDKVTLKAFTLKSIKNDTTRGYIANIIRPKFAA